MGTDDQETISSSETSRETTNKSLPLKALTEKQQAAILGGVVALLRELCPKATERDGQIFDESGSLNEVGRFWAGCLSGTSREQFTNWRKAIESGRITMPLWFPTVMELQDQIRLARDLKLIGEKQPPPPPLKALPGETNHDHLRARTTGDNPAIGPMDDDWIRDPAKESHDEYRERMIGIIEHLDPRIAARFREIRVRRQGNAPAEN